MNIQVLEKMARNQLLKSSTIFQQFLAITIPCERGWSQRFSALAVVTTRLPLSEGSAVDEGENQQKINERTNDKPNQPKGDSWPNKQHMRTTKAEHGRRLIRWTTFC